MAEQKTKEELAHEIRAIVCEQLGVSRDQVTAEASLTVDLGADELDRVELVMAMEEQYGISVELDEAEAIDTFGKLVDAVQGHLTGGGQSDGK